MPAGLGCVLALVTVPIALVAGMLTGLFALLLPGSRGRATAFSSSGSPRPFARRPASSAAALSTTGFALCSLVEKMSLDTDFSLEDAQTAGIPIEAEVTIESLLQDAVARGWVERRGERYAVTPRGRDETPGLLQRRPG